MGLTIFEIYLSAPYAVYSAGSMLEGQVTVGLDKAMKLKEIRLKFKGKAKVRWTEIESNNRDSDTDMSQRTVTYEDSETYLNQDMTIFAQERGGRSTELGNGTHTFSFNLQLPSTIPSSYEDRIGKVKYSVECKLVRPWKTDLTKEQPFIVFSPLGLNLLNSYRPVNGSNQKRLVCLCCESGPISASLYLDRQGYMPGEAIAVKPEINNDSSRRISKSIVVLEMESRYNARQRSKTVRRAILCMERPGFRAGDDDVWNGEQLVIPPLPPSFMNHCRLIDVQYRVKLRVVPNGPARDLEVALQVFIGNIPLRSVAQQHQPWAQPAQGTYTPYGASPAWATHPPLPSGMPNQPPPTF